jgi:hypothetical protein
MTLQRAKELLNIQIDIAGGYNRNAARVILAEVSLKLGQQAVDQLIRELNLNEIFGFNVGQSFSY